MTKNEKALSKDIILQAIRFLLDENEEHRNNPNFGDSKDFCDGYERALKNLYFIVTVNL